MPYIQGVTPGNIKYEVRNNNTWTNLSGAPISTDNSYTDEWRGRASSPLAPFGWALDYDWTNVKFTDQRPTTTQLARATLRYQFDPQVRLESRRRYEDNDYPSSPIAVRYTAPGCNGIRPADSLNANWEHRFFGASYLIAFEHRRPLSSITVKASLPRRAIRSSS
jgi:uncharacterized protein (PEP-CTERM system associated)